MSFFNIRQIYEQCIEKERKTPDLVLQHQKTVNLFNVASSLWLDNDKIAIYHLSEGQFREARRRFFICAWLDIYCVTKNNNRLLDYGMNHITNALGSDDFDSINAYAQLRYQKGLNASLSMDEMVSLGESAIWTNTVQFFMSNDLHGVDRNLNILEVVTLPKLSKKEELLRIDFEFYKALLAKDRAKCEEILDQLLSPKVHAKRNDNPILNQYVSQPALGYAKLAWRLGVEVEVNSSLVPKALLPIEPLDHYEIPYDFLK